MKYKLKNKTEIYETQTDQTIQIFNDAVKAKQRLRHLNLGGGFDGFTPEFFLIKFQYLIQK